MGRTKTRSVGPAKIPTAKMCADADAMGALPQPHQFCSADDTNKGADGATVPGRRAKDTLLFCRAGIDPDGQPMPPLRRLPRNT
jgi:hypothetical protein